MTEAEFESARSLACAITAVTYANAMIRNAMLCGVGAGELRQSLEHLEKARQEMDGALMIRAAKAV